jgi:hypothetical protein
LLADINGDGIPDLLVVNSSSDDIEVSLGLPGGAFTGPVLYPVGKGPVSLVAGDFRGDGHVDLAVVNRGSNDVSVLLGRGDGTFEPQARYPVGVAPIGIWTGDFGGDGRLDLAVFNQNSIDVTFPLGNGDGTFTDRGQRGLSLKAQLLLVALGKFVATSGSLVSPYPGAVPLIPVLTSQGMSDGPSGSTRTGLDVPLPAFLNIALLNPAPMPVFIPHLLPGRSNIVPPMDRGLGAESADPSGLNRFLLDLKGVRDRPLTPSEAPGPALEPEGATSQPSGTSRSAGAPSWANTLPTIAPSSTGQREGRPGEALLAFEWLGHRGQGVEGQRLEHEMRLGAVAPEEAREEDNPLLGAAADEPFIGPQSQAEQPDRGTVGSEEAAALMAGLYLAGVVNDRWHGRCGTGGRSARLLPWLEDVSGGEPRP